MTPPDDSSSKRIHKRERKRRRDSSSDSEDSPHRHRRKRLRKKRTRRNYDDSSSDKDDNTRHRHHKKEKKNKKKRKRRETLEGKDTTQQGEVSRQSESTSVSNEKVSANPKDDVIASQQASQSRRMAPMSREEYEAQQSIVREVYDPETDRCRLVRGTGEIIERIVSRSDHQLINQQATRGDGASFSRNVYQEARRL